MKTLIISLFVGVVSFTVNAQGPGHQRTDVKNHPRVNQVNGRVDNQEKRINRKKKNGQITQQQAQQDRQNLKSINQEKRLVKRLETIQLGYINDIDYINSNIYNRHFDLYEHHLNPNAMTKNISLPNDFGRTQVVPSPDRAFNACAMQSFLGVAEIRLTKVPSPQKSPANSALCSSTNKNPEREARGFCRHVRRSLRSDNLCRTAACWFRSRCSRR